MAGWIAFTLSLTGIAAPIAVFQWMAVRHGDEIGWQEGGGFYVFCACVLLAFVIEVVALVLACRKPRTVPGQIAGIFSLVTLLVMGAVVAWAIVVTIR